MYRRTIMKLVIFTVLSLAFLFFLTVINAGALDMTRENLNIHIELIPSPEPCNTDADCNRYNLCIEDKCVIYDKIGQCYHTKKSCDDENPCTVGSCDPENGECSETPVNCDDGDKCTSDSCDSESGQCHHDIILSCKSIKTEPTYFDRFKIW